MVVADLIDDNTGCWNGMILDTYFLPFEAQKIRSIPICFTPQEDILIWPKSKDGMYSVKSGYQLLCAMERSEVASVSDNGEVKKFWLALQNKKGAELFITYCWSIWNRRNKLRVKEAVIPLEKIADQAQQYLTEF
nr:hypothetical protein CFP56_78738 [Quercus suber]